MFRTFRNELPSDLQFFFKPYVSVHDARKKDSFYITRFRTNAKLVRNYCNVLVTIYLASIFNYVSTALTA